MRARAGKAKPFRKTTVSPIAPYPSAEPNIAHPPRESEDHHRFSTSAACHVLPSPDCPGRSPRRRDSDEHLIALWLHGRSPGTCRAYAADIRAFLAHVGKPLRTVTVGDAQT